MSLWGLRARNKVRGMIKLFKSNVFDLPTKLALTYA